MIDLPSITINGRVIKYQAPAIQGKSRMLLLLHGWTGDENVMWIFPRNLPQDYWILAPRGPVIAGGGGYGWAKYDEYTPSTIEDYRSAATSLMEIIERFRLTFNLTKQEINLMGFSQGAGFAYTLMILFPAYFERVAGLAGFIPGGIDPFKLGLILKGKKAFIAHGSRDERVPIIHAQESVRVLEALGAQVTYCESNGGHKLGLDCLRQLELFFE